MIYEVIDLQSSVAIVGSAGFIGRAVCEHDGAGSIATFTRQNPLIVNGALSPQATDCGAIIWLASSINPLLAESSPELAMRDAVELEVAISAVAACLTPPRFVFVSSGGTVYGSGTPPHKESNRVDPVTAYGRAKLRLEERVRETLPNAVAVRVANAYGPGQPVARGQGVIAHWLRAIRRDEPVIVYGDPSTSRDYIYVSDVASALLLTARSAVSLPPVLNVGSGYATSLSSLLHDVIRVVQKERVVVEYSYSRSFDITANWLDVSLVRDCLGWNPQVTLPDGLAVAWEAARTYGDAPS